MAINDVFTNMYRVNAGTGNMTVANTTVFPTPATLTSAADSVAVGGTLSYAANGGTAITATYNGLGTVNGVTGVFITIGSAQYFLVDDATLAGTTAPTIDTTTPLCFAAGTLIATVNGDVKVEDLKAGDLVLTADGSTAAVKWLGRQARSTVFSDEAQVCPIRISAGALAAGVPSRDLLVTGEHGIVFDEAIVVASALVNGTTITRVAKSELASTVTYYHIETEGHAVVIAEGAAAETFIDNAGRERFDNFAEFVAAYGAEQDDIEPLNLPRAKSAREVPAAIKARIAARVADVAGGLAAAV